MKSILISIKPKWVAKILNGEKTIEVRKTCPEMFKNLKPYEGCSIDVYIYCTKKERLVYQEYDEQLEIDNKHYAYGDIELSGYVVAKFTLNKVVKYPYVSDKYDELIGSCLSEKELIDYSTIKYENGVRFVKTIYAWHIDNLIIFDEPKELSEFVKCDDKHIRIGNCFIGFGGIPRLTKAPQSWCYVEVEK